MVAASADHPCIKVYNRGMVSTPDQPNFSLSVQVSIERFPNGEKCQLFSVDASTPISDQDLEQIAQICSEERIYNLLFKDKFNGQPYTKEKAAGFIKWAQDGWQQNKWFTFLVRNPEMQIVAAIDIKSDNLADAEMGYWASESYPGVVTNATLALCDLARAAGYQQLHALVRPENERSANVVLRAQFTEADSVEEKGRPYRLFRKTL